MRRHAYLASVFLILVLIIIFVPLIYVLVMSFTPSERLFVSLIPRRLSIDNYKLVFEDTNHWRYYLNSWIISTLVALITIIIGSVGAYGLSRFDFKLKNSFILFILITQMLPGTLLIISYFQIVNRLGLYNTILALVLIDSTRTIPFVTLMLKSVFDSVPREIDQSAMIDGCSRIGVFRRIVVPVSASGLFAGFVFAFLDAYGELLYALTLTKDISTMPATVEMVWLLGRYVVSWERMIPLSILFSIPIFVLFASTQESFIRGLSAGSMSDV
jgi:multiple sugar transport system permease protein